MRLKTKEKDSSVNLQVLLCLLESYLVVNKSSGCDAKQHSSVGERQPCRK